MKQVFTHEPSDALAINPIAHGEVLVQLPNLNRNTEERIAVIGLGYVGLPLGVELADRYETVIGFDVSAKRVAELQQHTDTHLARDILAFM